MKWQQIAEATTVLEITGVGCIVRTGYAPNAALCFVPGVRVENMALVAGTHFIAQVTSSGSGGTVALKPNVLNLLEDMQRLCWQIEKCGASEELTTASAMASALLDKLKKL